MIKAASIGTCTCTHCFHTNQLETEMYVIAYSEFIKFSNPTCSEKHVKVLLILHTSGSICPLHIGLFKMIYMYVKPLQIH